jgi:hypothetical protein
MAVIKKTGAAATSKSTLNTKNGKISGGTSVSAQYGYGPIEASTERYDPDIEDRKTVGKKPIEIYVDELPEKCEECIFYVKNSEHDKVKEDESVYYCQLRALNGTAQFGGFNIMEPKTWMCPLLKINECERLVKTRNNHLKRIKELEVKVFGAHKGDNDGFYP